MPKGVKPGEIAKGTYAHEGTKRCQARECAHAWAMQPVSNFYKCKDFPDGLSGRCKTCCAREHTAQWPARALKRKVQHREWSHTSPPEYPGLMKHRRTWFRTRYGITPDDFLEMYSAQQGRCAICLTDFPSVWLTPIDHCHRTGRVCGLLCYRCNSAIGKLQESSAVLLRAAEYVRTRKEAG